MYITSIALLLISTIGLPMVTPQGSDGDLKQVLITTNPYTSTTTSESTGYTTGWFQQDFKDGTNETLEFNFYIWDRPFFGEEDISETYAKKPSGHATCAIAAKRPFTEQVSFSFSNNVITGFDFDGEKSDDVRVWCETLSGDDLGTLEGKEIDSDKL